MGLFDFFPYTSGHTLNLDWIIKKVGDIPSQIKREVKEAVSAITPANLIYKEIRTLNDADELAQIDAIIAERTRIYGGTDAFNLYVFREFEQSDIGGIGGYGYIYTVKTTEAGYAVVEAAQSVGSSTLAYRWKDNGVWSSEWEWVNAPLNRGIVYRTMERYMGKPVYTVSFSLGEAVDNKLVQYPIVGARSIIRAVATCDNHPLPYYGESREDVVYIAVDFAQYEMYIRTNEYNANKNVYAQIWFVKESL